MFITSELIASFVIVQLVNAALLLCSSASELDFLLRNNITTAKVVKRATTICPITLSIGSVFHWLRVDKSGEPYVIYHRPIPPLLLFAQTKVMGGDSCLTPSSIKWHWTATINTELINLPLSFNTSRSYFYIFKRYLPNDAILIAVAATIGENAFSQMIKVLVYPTPIALVLNGGAIRTVSGGQDVVLNATGSYDPDRRVDLSSMRFEWFCKIIEIHPDLGVLNPILTKSSELTLENEKYLPSYVSKFNHDQRSRNCEPDLRFDLAGGMQCLDQRLSNYEPDLRFDLADQRLSNYEPDLRFDLAGEMQCLGLENPFTSESGPIIVIKADQLSSSHHYIFKVTVIVDSPGGPGPIPESSQQQELTIIDDEPLPNINIRCVYNCYENRFNFMESLVMVSEGEAGFANEMRWHVSHETDAKEDSKSYFHTSVWSRNLFARSKNILSFPPNTFQPGETLVISRNIVTRAGELSLSTVKLNSASLIVLERLNNVLCKIEPSTGITLTTSFSILCSHMEDLLIINVELYQLFKYTGEVGIEVTGILLTYGEFPIVDNVRLAPGEENYKSRVLVRVILEDYVRKDILIDVEVKPFQESGLCPSREELAKCLGDQFVFGTKETPLNLSWLITGGHLLEAYSMVHIIAKQLNDNATTLLKMNMRNKMVSIFSGMPIVETSSIVQMGNALFDIFNPDDDAHSVTAQKEALLILVNATWHLYNLNDIKLPKMGFIYQAAKSCIYAIDRIHQVAHNQVLWVLLEESASFGITIVDIIKQAIFSLHVMDQMWNHLGNSLLKNELANANPYFIITDLFTIYFARQRVKVNADCPAFIAGPISLPQRLRPSSYIAICNRTDLDDQTLDIHIVDYHKGYINDSLIIDLLVDSGILNLHIRQVSSGNYITNFRPPINVIIAASKNHSIFDKIYTIPLKTYSNYSEEDIFVARFRASDFINPASIFFAVSSLNSKHSLQVVCSTRRPSLSDFESRYVQVFHGDSWNYHHKPFFGEGNNSCAPKEFLSSQIGVTNNSEFLYFGVLPTKQAIINIFNEKDAKVSKISFTASLLGISCYRWTFENWNLRGCQPVISAGNNNPQFIHCRCTQLSTVVALRRCIPFFQDRYSPLQINLSVKFNLIIVYFLLGLALVAIIFILIGLCISWHLQYQRGVTLLKDNDPYYHYGYLVSVHTGYRPRSSTSSFVTIRLMGLNGNSLYFNLEDRSRTILYNGAQDLFLVMTKDTLGVLQGVSILVTPHGKSPDWYLREIRVYDLLTHHAWMFKANRWIRTKGQDQVELSLNSKAYTSKGIDDEYSYGDRLVQRFYEDYIFITGVLSSTASSFTSAKKLFCVVLIVLIALVINLLLRGVPTNDPTQHIFDTENEYWPQEFKWAGITAPILLVFALLIVYAAKYSCSQWRKWHVFIDHDENWKELFTNSWPDLDVETYVVAVDDVTLTITISNKPPEYSVPNKAEKQRLKRCGVCDKNTWCFWGVGSVLCISLLIVIIIFGLRFGFIQSLLWIFSSVLGFLFCAYILFPIALLILAAILPPITSDKHTKRVLFHRRLAALFQTRNVIIKRRGTLDEYVLYLNRLRHGIIYQPRQVRQFQPKKK